MSYMASSFLDKNTRVIHACASRPKSEATARVDNSFLEDPAKATTSLWISLKDSGLEPSSSAASLTNRVPLQAVQRDDFSQRHYSDKDTASSQPACSRDRPALQKVAPVFFACRAAKIFRCRREDAALLTAGRPRQPCECQATGRRTGVLFDSEQRTDAREGEGCQCPTPHPAARRRLAEGRAQRGQCPCQKSKPVVGGQGRSNHN
jgi:hypothetical protein